jgi:hypothetical protein
MQRIPRVFMLDLEWELATRRYHKSGTFYVPAVEYEAVRLSEAGYKPPAEWIEEGWPNG